MKKNLLWISCILVTCHALAQNAPVIKPRTDQNSGVVKPKPVTTKAVTDCKVMSGAAILEKLKSGEFREVSAKLDRDDGYLKIGSIRNSFKIAEKKVNKPGHDWRYHVNDINSFRHDLSFSNNAFWLQLEFEGNGSEIKGLCPGCLNRFEDSRAPDFNWEGSRRIRIKLKPVAYNKSITFEAEKVEMEGKFEINGPSDILMPVLNALEVAMKNEMQKQIKKFLNTASVKQRISASLAPLITQMGIESASKVYITEGQVFVCGKVVSYK